MNLPRKIAIINLFIVQFHFSQVSITTSNYSQNFGTTAEAATTAATNWSPRSVFPGWYLSAGGTFNFAGTFNVNTIALASFNNGGFYLYHCGDNNMKLGSRPSNGSGGASGSGQSHMGVRFVNNTGSSIESIRISFTAYQFSTAENVGTGGANPNSLTFSYRISSSAITDLTSGSYTSLSALNYTAPNNQTSGTGSSNQIAKHLCNVSEFKTLCVDVAIPNGHELMLRWSDLNNTNNDHHLGIDDVQVGFSTSQNNCSVLLPVDFENFEASCSANKLNLKWETTSERNNDYFLLEGSKDGFSFEEIQKVKGMGNSSQLTVYSEELENSSYEYLRLKQVDFDGVVSELQTIESPCHDDSKIQFYPNPIKDILTIDNLDLDSQLIIRDSFGKLIYCERVSMTKLLIDFTNYANGFYFLEISKNNSLEVEKLIKQN